MGAKYFAQRVGSLNSGSTGEFNKAQASATIYCAVLRLMLRKWGTNDDPNRTELVILHAPRVKLRCNQKAVLLFLLPQTLLSAPSADEQNPKRKKRPICFKHARLVAEHKFFKAYHLTHDTVWDVQTYYSNYSIFTGTSITSSDATRSPIVHQTDITGHISRILEQQDLADCN